MKKKSIFVLLLVMILASFPVLTGCGKSGDSGGSTDGPETLEQYAVNNPAVQQSIDNATADSDVEVGIKGNDVTYSFELSKMEGYTEDVAKDPAVIESLQTALDNAGPTFGGIAKTLENVTGISGIHVVVNYTYNDETLATQTFDSSQANDESNSAGQEEASSDESDDSEESAE